MFKNNFSDVADNESGYIVQLGCTVDLAANLTSRGTSPLLLRTAVPVFNIISGS